MNTHARIAALETQIDTVARAADVADHEATRHHPGQDVRAARRHARRLREQLHPLFKRLNRLKALHEAELEAAQPFRAHETRTFSAWLYAASALLFLVPLSSCSLGPSHFERTSAQGNTTVWTTAGVSIFTKNQYEQTTVSKGNFTASHTVVEKDEVALPRYKAQAEVAKALGQGLGDATKEIIDAAKD